MPVSVVCNLGIYMDADVSMRSHVSKTVAACFASLRQLRSIRRSVPRSVLQSLVSSLSGWTMVMQRWLAFHPISPSGCRRCWILLLGLCFLHRSIRPHHATATQLHWLSLKVPERIKFKLAVLVYKCLHQTSPPYLAEELHQSSARQRLRFASTSSLVVWRTRLSTIGDRDFPVAVVRLWNTLPLNVTSASSICGFRKHLKTHLFRHPFPESPVAPVHFVIFGHYNRSFYLLTYLLTYLPTPLRGMAGHQRVVICSHCGLTRLFYHKN